MGRYPFILNVNKMAIELEGLFIDYIEGGNKGLRGM